MGQALSGVSCTIPVTVRFGEVVVDHDVSDNTNSAENDQVGTDAAAETPKNTTSETTVETAAETAADAPSDVSAAPIADAGDLSFAGARARLAEYLRNKYAVVGSADVSEDSSDDSDDSDDSSESDDSDDEAVEAVVGFVDPPPGVIQKAVEISLVDTNDHTAIRQGHLIMNNGELDEDDALQAAIALSELDK